MNESNLHNYQKTAVNHILKNPFCGLILDMGLGKTVSTLTAINKLVFEELEISRVLVIAPKMVVQSVWPDEVTKWDHLQHLKIIPITGKPRERKAALKEKGHVYLISRDNVAWLCGEYGGGPLPFEMLIIDESSSFKNHKSVRFKSLRKVSFGFDRRVILTGTPAPNGLIDLWAQMYLLDQGERLGKSITAYRDQYFKPNQRNGAIVYNYKLKESAAEDVIYNKIKDICLSMKAVDFLDMPEKVENVVRIKMPETLQTKYKEFEAEQVLSLIEGGEITAVNAAALSTKLLQFANGAVYDDDKNVHEVHTLKLDALEELIEEANGRPVLVAWTYRHDAARIMERLKKYGPVQLKTNEHKRDWNAGKIPVMLMHPASGGHGLNLQEGGNRIVWFGNTWSLELEQQLNARLYRQGQKANQVFIYRLCLEGSLDTRVLSSNKSKDSKQERLLKAIKFIVDQYGNN